jgi:hypothetical protein
MKACLTFVSAGVLALLLTVFAHGYAAILNKDDHKEIHIVPAPGKVVVDGDLSDWDLSGAILMYLDEASKKVYSVRGAMIYDQEALYIGGHVKDPSPLINHYSFADDPGLCWDADAVQVRFVSDPGIKSSASLQTGANMPAEQQKHVCHLTMWHSTRDQKPGFYICYTLNFADGKLNPPGVTGAYRKDADGKGYTFEYRVPWSVLRAKRPLRGGDQVQVQWQQHWGLDVGRGLRCGLTDIRNPVSGDLGYMGPASWGTGIFEKTGRLKLPQAEAGTGARPDGHIPIPLKLDNDARVSLAVYDSAGKLVRTCLGAEPVSASPRKGESTSPDRKGTQSTSPDRKGGVYLWDGLDDRDQPLPAGPYTYKLLAHQGIKPRLVCDVGVSGTPPYQTEDGTGGWAGDYNTPWNLAIDGDRVILGTTSAEAAPATIAVDLEGKKIFGTSATGGALAVHKGFGYFVQRGNGKLIKLELGKGYLVPFAGGKAEAVIIQRRPKEADPSWNHRSWTLNAAVVHNGVLVISSFADNKLILVDPSTGVVKGEAPLTAPWGLAAGAKGELYAVSGASIGRYDLAARNWSPIANDLGQPRHLARDETGNLFVSLQGKTQQVWKLSPQGKVLQKYGKADGRPTLGKFDPAGMLNPYAIAVDKNGRLWVAEADDQPKRYSVWNADGTLYKDFFGSQVYSTRAWADPGDPRFVYALGVRYKVDYDKGAWAVDATVFRNRSEGKVEFKMPGHHHGAVMVNYKGRKFIWVREVGYGALHEVVGGGLIPRMVIQEGNKPWWIDRNNDGRVQDDELFKNPGSMGFPWMGIPMDARLNIYGYTGDRWANQGNPPSSKPFQVLRWDCLGFNAQGGLQFSDPKKPTLLANDATGGWLSDLHVDDEGNAYALVSGGSLERGVRAQGSGHRVVKYSPMGKVLWEYHNVHCAFAWTSDPYTPGYLVGVSAFSSGSTRDLIALTGYYGQYFLLDRRDGLFVDALGEDQRSGYTMGQHMVLTENFNGFLFADPKSGKSYFLGGDADTRLWELTGLDKLQRRQGTIQVTPAQAARSRENAKKASMIAFASRRRKTAFLPRLAGSSPDRWNAAQPLPIVLEAGRSALGWLGYDDKNLYARFQVQSDVPLLNTPTDPKLLFKSGASIELQLGTDLSNRTVQGQNVQGMAVGDLRLIVSRTKDQKMVATLYRPRTADAAKPNKTLFKSPTGQEEFDDVVPWNDLPMSYTSDKGGYVVELAIPWQRLGIQPKTGMTLIGDVGVIFGNQGGTRNAVRYLWSDKSPEVSINNDIPSEVRIHPNQWGKWVLK